MATLNLADAAVLADPYPFYRELRDQNPVLFDENHRYWLVTGYADVRAALRNPQLSVERVDRFIDSLPETTSRHTAFFAAVISHWLFVLDDPRHSQLRVLLHDAFTVQRIEQLTDAVASFVKQLLDGALNGAGRQGFDVMAALANPLPAMALAELLGLPVDDWPLLRASTDAIVQFIGTRAPTCVQASAAADGLRAMCDYILSHAERAATRSPLMCKLRAEQRRGTLSELEFLALCTVLINAGLETTTDLIGNAILALARQPQSLAALLLNDANIGVAVEEFLRFDSPVQVTARIARERCNVAGERIQKGEMLLLFLGAANRDPQRFREPDRLDPMRQDNRHLAFSHGLYWSVARPDGVPHRASGSINAMAPF